VEEMTNNGMNQSLALKDGRCLGFAEYGATTGRPVFYFHGSASSRLDRPSSETMLAQMDIHFISVDRPGHGLSDWQAGRRLIDWPQDIGQLADSLGIGEFYVAGHSAGGPHALACAHQLTGRVLAGAAISSVAPMSRPEAYRGMPVLNQILARSARHCAWLTNLVRRTTRNMVMGDAEEAIRRLMASIPDTDKAALYAPQNREILVSSLREGFRQDYRGVAHDDILVNREWGFDLESVRPRIDIWHGEVDVNVPIHAGEYLRDRLPDRRAFFLAGAGHFFFLTRWEEILSELVHEE
jgi:pimeloyl-ACP methyl ester carboxylesterase